MVSPDVVGIGSEYFVVYFRTWYVYICSADYVGLPVLLYLLQCLVYHMLSKMRRSSGIYIEGNRWGIGVRPMYKISYSSCMWTRQDVIGVFPSYYCIWCNVCLSWSSISLHRCYCCLPIDSTTYHSRLCRGYLILYKYYRACIFLGWIVSADAGLSGSRRILVVRDLVRCLVLKLCQKIRLYGNL